MVLDQGKSCDLIARPQSYSHFYAFLLRRSRCELASQHLAYTSSSALWKPKLLITVVTIVLFFKRFCCAKYFPQIYMILSPSTILPNSSTATEHGRHRHQKLIRHRLVFLTQIPLTFLDASIQHRH